MDETRYEQLETKLAFLEDAHEKLEAVVLRQHEEIDALRGLIERLESRLQAALDGQPGAEEHQPPPHY